MYYVKKSVSLLATILLITMLTFLAFSIVPGDAAIVNLGTEATPEAVEALRGEMGLNDNVFVRFGRWFTGAVRGDFGLSTYYKVPVSDLISERIGISVRLAVLSLVIILFLSVPLAVLCTIKPDGIVGKIIMIINQICMSIPAFFLGMIVILVFGLWFAVFDIGGYVDVSENAYGFYSYMFYPALAIAIPKSAMVVKFLRSNIISELKKDYVNTLYMTGAGRVRVLLVHVLKNSLVPAITFLGIIAAEVMAGSVIIEQVFQIPGIGRLLVQSVGTRDYNVLQAIMLYIGTAVVTINFLVDLLYHVVDPTIDRRD
ncbi:MAG: ABC transporter permease [Clostridiales bacterium]|nr:ABC transporter permease [Clostridiales bacterium]